jgi:hypothetical protein
MTYHIQFDLGDPDVIKPYNGKYQVLLVVADQLLANQIHRWFLFSFRNVAEVDISFKNPIQHGEKLK